MTRHLIAIDGIDGSGKTLLAARLEKECKTRSLDVELLRIDAFRRRVDWNHDDADEASLYYDDYYDFAGVERCLRAFVAGDPGFEVPTFDSVTEEITGSQELCFSEREVLILEGVFTLRAPVTADGTLVYLATTYDEARRRIIERDMAKNRSREEVERRVDRRYFPCQRRYHREYDPRSCAHLVIDNENPFQPRATTSALGDLPRPLRAALEALVAHHR